MSVRMTQKAETVARCVPRQDGGWLIVTRKGQSGSSPVELPEGVAVFIEQGAVRRVNP